MTRRKYVQVGDIGTRIGGYLKHQGQVVNISPATVRKIRLEPPGGPSLEYDAVLLTNGDDGGLYYATQAGNLHTAGVWKMQAFVTLPSGSWSSRVYEFTVRENI